MSDENKKEKAGKVSRYKKAVEVKVTKEHATFFEKVNKLGEQIHWRLFPEEYDFISDSISDAQDRKRGINPMSEEYIRQVDEKRRLLGFNPLPTSGQAETHETLLFCIEIAKKALMEVKQPN